MSAETTRPWVIAMFGADGGGKTTFINQLVQHKLIAARRPVIFPGQLLAAKGDEQEGPWITVATLQETGLVDDFIDESVTTWARALRTRRRVEEELRGVPSPLFVVDSSPPHKTWATRILGSIGNEQGPNAGAYYQGLVPLLGELCLTRDVLSIHVTLRDGTPQDRGEELQRRLDNRPSGRSPFDPNTAEDSLRSLIAYGFVAQHLRELGAPVMTVVADRPVDIDRYAEAIAARV